MARPPVRPCTMRLASSGAWPARIIAAKARRRPASSAVSAAKGPIRRRRAKRNAVSQACSSAAIRAPAASSSADSQRAQFPRQTARAITARRHRPGPRLGECAIVDIAPLGEALDQPVDHVVSVRTAALALRPAPFGNLADQVGAQFGAAGRITADIVSARRSSVTESSAGRARGGWLKVTRHVCATVGPDFER